MIEVPLPSSSPAVHATADDLLEAACWAEGRGQTDRAARLLLLREQWLGHSPAATTMHFSLLGRSVEPSSA